MLMTTTVGTFDNARDLDRAIERLTRAGFEDTVYNEAIVGEEAIGIGMPVFAPGSAPAVVWGSPEPASPSKPDRYTIVRAFKAHLRHCHLPNEVIEAYANSFYHGGEFVLVRTDTGHAAQVTQILLECGATQVNSHENSPPSQPPNQNAA